MAYFDLSTEKDVTAAYLGNLHKEGSDNSEVPVSQIRQCEKIQDIWGTEWQTSMAFNSRSPHLPPDFKEEVAATMPFLVQVAARKWGDDVDVLGIVVEAAEEAGMASADFLLIGAST